MPKSLKLFIALLVAGGAIALLATSFVFPLRPDIALELDGLPGASSLELFAGVAFWTLATFLASALPVQMPGGFLVTVSIAPIIAATAIGGPFAGGLVALIGTTEIREIRGKVPWYGSLANHAGLVMPAIACGLVIEGVRSFGGIGVVGKAELVDFVATVLGAFAYFVLNLVLVSIVVALRTSTAFKQLLIED